MIYAKIVVEYPTLTTMEYRKLWYALGRATDYTPQLAQSDDTLWILVDDASDASDARIACILDAANTTARRYGGTAALFVL